MFDFLQLGHADFYPNGGRASQPGCRGKEGFGLDCSHQRANVIFWAKTVLEALMYFIYTFVYNYLQKLYAESINSKVGFKAYKCPSWKSFKVSFQIFFA
jgi:hypothetical protein